MIITYPDQITHKAITDTLCGIFISIPATGSFGFPELVIIQDDEFKVGLTDEENKIKEIVSLAELFKSTVLKNMAF